MNEIEIRQVTPADHTRCCVVEMVCFDDDEAASPESIRARIEQFPQGFFVAEEGGEVIGQVNCGCSSKPNLADEEFKKLVGHDPDGDNMVVFSLSVLPEYQGKGLGGRLMDAFIQRSRELHKQAVLLLCKEGMIPFYHRLGFEDQGLSDSCHGGVAWHEMRLSLNGDLRS